jgi:hypothetical protein
MNPQPIAYTVDFKTYFSSLYTLAKQQGPVDSIKVVLEDETFRTLRKECYLKRKLISEEEALRCINAALAHPTCTEEHRQFFKENPKQALQNVIEGLSPLKYLKTKKEIESLEKTGLLYDGHRPSGNLSVREKRHLHQFLSGKSKEGEL